MMYRALLLSRNLTVASNRQIRTLVLPTVGVLARSIKFAKNTDRLLKQCGTHFPSNLSNSLASLSTHPFSDDKSGHEDAEIKTETPNDPCENNSRSADNEKEISQFLAKHEITVSDPSAPQPILRFQDGQIPNYLLQKVRKDFDGPTPIQAQALPIALSGSNMVGIGQTGSGKTLAFLLPALVHINNSDRQAEAPVALVLAPTRELAQQIEEVAVQYRSVAKVRTVCCIGGESKRGQLYQYDRGPQLMIATPGRLNDFLEQGEMSVSDVSYVVLDEADRMLDMGFEPQIRAILELVNPDRQILMFSATWPEEVRELADEFLGEFTFMSIGSTELQANKNIEQEVIVCQRDYKHEAFLNKMEEIGQEKVLVFTQQKSTVDRLERILRARRIRAMGIHGDKSQRQRSDTLRRFRDGSCNVMIATDVAARGLDIKDVKFVVNFDFPLDIETYVHRIGRTARVDKKGTSVTYITPDDATHAHKLVKILQESNQEVTQDLHDLVKFGERVKSEVRQKKKQHTKRNRYGQPQDYSGVKRYRGLSDEDFRFDRRSARRYSFDDGGGDYSRGRPQRRSGDYHDDWDRKHRDPSLD